MKIRALLLVSLFALSACASAQRTFSYNGGMPDADVRVGTDRYQVWFHDRDQTVLVLRGEPRPLGQLMAQNVTVYANDASPGILWWGQAANAVLRPIGCYATEVTGSDQMREIQYTCPQPVDVNAAVAQRREEWRRGVNVEAPQG
ncbi:hypothetical protein [Terricaulis sp.]|uniref:hypothetical protein n=1 Tax=Terricaulis sp. TaxID=2768686 RepID=UPI002AC7A7B8|nr:hypothetical protein [Terricaulis sp.]MDZ4692222.1 hypothetical protein [Terricaulis sp.]